MTPACTLLHGGTVHTLDANNTTAQALLVVGDTVQAVGRVDDVRVAAPAGTLEIDLRGRTVVPGLFDAHPHMDREGLRAFGGRSLAGARSVDDVLERVHAAARETPENEWLVFMPLGAPPLGWITRPDQWRDSRFPSRRDLDRVSPRHPVYIRGVWGWWATPPFPSFANTAALRLTGIDRTTEAPPNVQIGREPDGEPDGRFFESNRIPILEYTLFAQLPRFTAAERRRAAELGAHAYSALGTTSAYEGHGLTPALLRAYRQAARAGTLSVRITAPISLPSTFARPDVEAVVYDAASIASDGGTHVGALRIDGVTLDPGDPRVAKATAAGYPYEQWAGFFAQGFSEEEFVRFGTAAVRQGLRLNTFVVDAPPLQSVERGLRLLEAIDRNHSIRDLRCVAMHLGRATDSQLDRLRDLGVGVTMIPAFLYQHARVFQLADAGDDALPIERILARGIPLALASDNVPPSMLFAMWECLARVDAERGEPVGRAAVERRTLLRLCSCSGHWLNREEHERGPLAAGRRADLVVLDEDPLTCEVDRLLSLRVELTMVDGRIVWEPDRRAEANR